MSVSDLTPTVEDIHTRGFASAGFADEAPAFVPLSDEPAEDMDWVEAQQRLDSNVYARLLRARSSADLRFMVAGSAALTPEAPAIVEAARQILRMRGEAA